MNAASRQVGIFELIVQLLPDGRAIWLVAEGREIRAAAAVQPFENELACSVLARATMAGEREAFERSFLKLSQKASP